MLLLQDDKVFPGLRTDHLPAAAGGLLFSATEIAAFKELAGETRQLRWPPESFKTVTI